MQLSNVPPRIPLPWAAGANPPYITSGGIPTPSQQSVKSGAASFNDGFPPLCFVPVSTGGAGPFGADFNAALNQFTAGLQWIQAGGPQQWNSAFSSAIGGYANGALIASATVPGLWWRSTIDNNTSNPDAGGANWIGSQLLTGDIQIIQVGASPTINCTAGWGQIAVPFPIAFPHACLQVIASDDAVFTGVVAGSVVYACSTFTASSFLLTAALPANPTGSEAVNARYIAVGF